MNWKEDFHACFRECQFLPSIPTEVFPRPKSMDRWGLVIWDASIPVGGRVCSHSLEKARHALEPGGALFLLASNRLSLKAFARQKDRIFSRGVSTSWNWRHRLHRAGFDTVLEFLPLPGLSCPEEFVESRLGEIALSSQFSFIEKGLATLGLFRFFHEGYIYLASGTSGGTRRILDPLAGEISRNGGMTDQLVLERFDLRDRGALLLLVREARSLRRLVARVATSTMVDDVVGRNALWVEKIRNNDRISPGIKSKVPRQCGSYRIGESKIYVEELVEGVLAWKVVHEKKIQDPLFQGVYGFIRDFNQGTVVKRRIQGSLCAQLIYGGATNGAGRELSDHLSMLQAQLFRKLQGNDVHLVWAHGDYGYGNAIVDPRSGGLNGVIDWDQAREDLAGVDLLNFLLQKHRIEAGGSLPSSIRDFGDRLVKKGLRSLDERIDYAETFSIKHRDIPVLLGVVVLRMVLQEASYSGSIEQQDKPQLHLVEALKEAIRFLMETA